MEIPYEDQSSHYDYEKDNFAYLSMRDRIELGKRQVQQSQWGSKYALNEDMSMKAKLASMARRIEEFELRNVHTEAQPQAMPTSFEYINHPNLATQPQPQPSMIMEDFVGEQQRSTLILMKRLIIWRDRKVQDSIEKLTNLDIARGQGRFLLNPTITFKEPIQKIKESVEDRHFGGDCYDNSMDQPSIKNHKVQDDKGLPNPLKHPLLREEKRNEFPWTKWEGCQFCLGSRGIQHEVGIMLAKIEAMVKTKENRGEKPKQSNSHHPISATESIASNGARFGVETKKLWSLQENCTELSGNFAHLNPRCENFRTVRNTSWHTSAISHTSSQISHGANQGAKISHTTIQGAKFIPRCEFSKHRFSTPCSRCENFCTVETLSWHTSAISHTQANFHTTRFGVVPGGKIMYTIYQFEAWEVRNPVLQTVHDLDLKRRTSKWAAKMFFFSLWLQDMASKLQNDMQKHFAKPREITKMLTEPRNHASKEENPLTELTHEASHSISDLPKPSQPIAPAESSSKGDYATQGDYQSRGQCPDPTHSEGHHRAIISTGPYHFLIISLIFVFTYYISIYNSMF
ncbi:hypothetical protein AAG906_016782 [Vitis piasezkii]